MVLKSMSDFVLSRSILLGLDENGKQIQHQYQQQVKCDCYCHRVDITVVHFVDCCANPNKPHSKQTT